MRFFLLVMMLVNATAFAKNDIEIKSGTRGTTYCTPMEDPRCKSHRAVEMQRLIERMEYERRFEEMDRRQKERERELDRRYENNYRR